MKIKNLCTQLLSKIFKTKSSQSRAKYYTFKTIPLRNWKECQEGNILHVRKGEFEDSYEQITEQIKQAILSGTLLPGAALPSIRMLAKELKISVMTTKRAYSDLERDGFIETVAGKGSFVAYRNQEFLREALVRHVEEYLIKAIGIARTAGMSHDELLELMKLLLEDEEK